MKKIVISVLAIISLLALAACGNSPNAQKKISGVPDGVQGGKRIAVIRNLTSDDHTKQFLDGARTEGQAFGFKVDTFISNGDDARFQELVNQAIQGNYDGLIISHGKKPYSYQMIKPAVDKGIKVVTFDTIIDSNGKTLKDVTTTFQDDKKLAEMSLTEIAALSKNGKPVNVIKLWFGGLPPLDKRDTIYQKFEKENKIKTLETIGPTNMQDVQGDINAKVSSILSKYPAGTVDAVWASWDELAKGAYKAMKENKRNDMKMISIDISNQDINLMREKGSTWLSTAAVDPKLIGTLDMRLLAKKLAGEQVPASFEIKANLIKKDQLTPESNMVNLNKVIQGWGESKEFDEAWMQKLRDQYGKK
ncbi:simple sugar transport system substrate-binding protein [Seinonella peptonophila]|uniref:Simple sugar transport system substrate-binding protein n=1 Tax=Seinonella peptonophila TaxID=112248 RepID=A0A1M4ZG52_9BACL|nr:sugar ABC transporter substrate-binding protein [Seinonella peptonophila]SHF17034.1 simple sugar transport system substrate-binding protein [Seinonella peptonophila]